MASAEILLLPMPLRFFFFFFAEVQLYNGREHPLHPPETSMVFSVTNFLENS